jgi:pimeloyl-ACP methyl ester carboxylesterase
MTKLCMEIRSVDIKGHQLRVGIRPASSATPPLLIFNGIGANLELVEPFVAALNGVETIIFDIPGIGGSPLPPRPYRMSHLAHLAERLLAKLGYRGQVDVIGISWCGALAQEFAHLYPRCRRLILASTSPGAIMVPGRLSKLAKLIRPRRIRIPSSSTPSGANFMAAPIAAIRACCASTAGISSRRAPSQPQDPDQFFALKCMCVIVAVTKLAAVLRARLRNRKPPPPFRYRHQGSLATIGHIPPQHLACPDALPAVEWLTGPASIQKRQQGA